MELQCGCYCVEFKIVPVLQKKTRELYETTLHWPEPLSDFSFENRFIFLMYYSIQQQKLYQIFHCKPWKLATHQL